ncbi:MAG TPA: trimeric intracellular cation channel family protein [Dissulfurispiraceae bacterium]|nr:trimeric intracellular cation channel family protein [Dissulfurispiraceae bacterium]
MIHALDLIYALDLVGTFAFAVSGAFRAVKYELDLLGVIILAAATGIGGGIIRDILLSTSPPSALHNEIYLLICLLGALIVFIAAPKIASRWDSVMLADAVGLGVFAAIGAAQAELSGAAAFSVIIMAALTACGGGVIRDILVKEIPAILTSDFYATAALIGGGCFVALRPLGWSPDARLACAIIVTIVLRLFAMRYGISLPKVKRLPASPSQLTQIRKAAKKAPKIPE